MRSLYVNELAYKLTTRHQCLHINYQLLDNGIIFSSNENQEVYVGVGLKIIDDDLTENAAEFGENKVRVDSDCHSQ